MTNYCAQMGMRSKNLNTFLHLFTPRLRVWSPVLLVLHQSMCPHVRSGTLLYQHYLPINSSKRSDHDKQMVML